MGATESAIFTHWISSSPIHKGHDHGWFLRTIHRRFPLTWTLNPEIHSSTNSLTWTKRQLPPTVSHLLESCIPASVSLMFSESWSNSCAERDTLQSYHCWCATKKFNSFMIDWSARNCILYDRLNWFRIIIQFTNLKFGKSKLFSEWQSR